ncbi:MAG: hypothetical protein HUU20_08105 [Pirellulales bacterium]|nr:hypothetical protein [Pirellulales bacterium]
MIGRLLQGLTSAVLYFCLATIIAETILAAQLWVKWKMDRAKLIQMLAVAQGIDPLALRAKSDLDKKEIPADQVSYDEILEARAAKDLNLQLREQSLANSLGQMRSDQQQLSSAQKQYNQQRTQYETELAGLQEEVRTAGRDQVRRILETVKPKQAKELLAEMLDKQEMAAVVMLLREMPDSKRAKIVGEFKTQEETQKIDEVLRRIREGEPESAMANNAQERLGQVPRTRP